MVEKLDGTQYDLKDFGLFATAFDIDSPAPKITSEEVEGRDGVVDMGATFEARTMRASFVIKGNDRIDYLLLLDEIFRIFDGRTLFYLIDKAKPRKRWKVRTAGVYAPERVGVNRGRVEIPFISPSPYAESHGTTLDPLTFTSEKWQVGQGLTLTEPKYVHSASSFQIYNASDIDIDPREIPLKITYRGASNNLKIKNATTGDEWAHTGSSATNDNIVLDGVRSFKNNLTIFGNTNHKLLSLKPGWNDIQLSGTSGSFLISFDFKFYTI